MYIEFYNIKKTIRDKEETFSDDLAAIDFRLFGFPVFCIDLCTADSYFWFMLLGFGFAFSWK